MFIKCVNNFLSRSLLCYRVVVDKFSEKNIVVCVCSAIKKFVFLADNNSVANKLTLNKSWG